MADGDRTPPCEEDGEGDGGASEPQDAGTPPRESSDGHVNSSASGGAAHPNTDDLDGALPPRDEQGQPKVPHALRFFPTHPIRRDVLDKYGAWHQGQIVFVDQGKHRVLVHFTFWSSAKFDEWVPLDSSRLAPLGSHVFLGNNRGVIAVGSWLDIYDEHPRIRKYLVAHVIQVRPGEIRVHYRGYKPEYDEWIPVGSTRI